MKKNKTKNKTYAWVTLKQKLVVIIQTVNIEHVMGYQTLGTCNVKRKKDFQVNSR